MFFTKLVAGVEHILRLFGKRYFASPLNMTSKNFYLSRRTSEVAGEVMWRMFWLQGTEGQMAQEMDASVGAELVNAYCYAPGAPPSQGQEELLKFEKLDELTRIHIQEQNEAGARHERHYSVPELDDYREHNLSQAIIDEMRAKADVQSEQAIKDFVADTPDERKRKLRDYDVGQQDIGKVVRLKDHESGVSQEGLQSALSWVSAPCTTTENEQAVPDR